MVEWKFSRAMSELKYDIPSVIKFAVNFETLNRRRSVRKKETLKNPFFDFFSLVYSRVVNTKLFVLLKIHTIL